MSKLSEIFLKTHPSKLFKNYGKKKSYCSACGIVPQAEKTRVGISFSSKIVFSKIFM